MKTWTTILILAMCFALSGCVAPTVRSDVTVFQDWPADLRGASFRFERSSEQANNLEYRTYENLVRNELKNLGLSDTESPSPATLQVTLVYSVNVRDVHIVEPVVIDPMVRGSTFFGSSWRPHDGRFRRSLYSPTWFGPPVVEYREDQYEIFTRQLKVTIARTKDSAKVYEVAVDSEGLKGALATVMPYMVRSAFLGFPGKNGETHHIVLPMKS